MNKKISQFMYMNLFVVVVVSVAVNVVVFTMSFCSASYVIVEGQ